MRRGLDPVLVILPVLEENQAVHVLDFQEPVLLSIELGLEPDAEVEAGAHAEGRVTDVLVHAADVPLMIGRDPVSDRVLQPGSPLHPIVHLEVDADSGLLPVPELERCPVRRAVEKRSGLGRRDVLGAEGQPCGFRLGLDYLYCHAMISRYP